ncbi:MAG: AraC family transcriptional regulator [Rhodovulum sulfidophilum]|uniref:AraC family transcriptional regulator n=1 Tax=Rhodovulum sulfidophilum TaxID=35806 RepID=A0A2W5PNV2_RHOSU|nr:MAG: AraC family transcriptional regulator [Rhodovulum sulfidophilum]
MQTDLPEIGIIRYPGAQMAAVLGLTDLFDVAARFARAKRAGDAGPILRVSHWDLAGEPERPTRIFDTGPDKGDAPSVLILPPALGDPISPETAARYADWLREQHRRGVVLSSVCAGALLLAASGVLAGRTVTTHWEYGDLLRARCPDVARIETDRLLIDDGDVITAGGVMAWTDLGLKLIDRFFGPTIMMETARHFLVDPPGREQRYYSVFSPRLTHGDAAVLKAQRWLQAAEDPDTSLPVLAAKAGLEERTFLRRFQKATGLTSTEYCQRLRISRAQERLQFSTLPVDRIACEVGYADPSAFRKVFTRIVGLTPNAFRRRFRA